MLPETATPTDQATSEGDLATRSVPDEPTQLSPEERAASRQARAEAIAAERAANQKAQAEAIAALAERTAAREAREAFLRDNPPEVLQLTRRFEQDGIPEEASRLIARYLTGHAEDEAAPDVTDALTVEGAWKLIMLERRYPNSGALLEPLRQRLAGARDTVTDWASAHELIRLAPRDIGPEFNAMVERMRQHPDAVEAGVDDATIEGWRQAVRFRLILRLVAQRSYPLPKAFQKSAQSVEKGSGAVWADPRGTLFVSMHNPHLGTLAQWAQREYPEFHALRLPDLRDPQSVRSQLSAFVRKLRKGGAGVMAPDGPVGEINRELDIFGEPLPVSDAFARIAWTSRCRLVFTVGSSQDRTTGLAPQLVDLPRRTDDMKDVEAYVDSVLDAFAAATRVAMVLFPFDTGINQRIGVRAEGAGTEDMNPERAGTG